MKLGIKNLFNYFEKRKIINDIKSGKDDLLDYASERLRDDKDVVIEAVKQDGLALYYVSERLKNDKDVVLVAVQQNTLLLQYESNRLQNDKEILEILETTATSGWFKKDKVWHSERMKFLNNLRNQEEKESMENLIISSNKTSKKIKF